MKTCVFIIPALLAVNYVCAHSYHSNENYPSGIEQSSHYYQGTVTRDDHNQDSNNWESKVDRGSNYSNSNQPVKIADDETLRQKIKDALKGGWFSKGYEGVTAQINDGNVVLSGNVSSVEEKRDAEQKVRNINGIRHINNQITVSEKSSDPKSSDPKSQENRFSQDRAASTGDQQLNQEIRKKISEGWFGDHYQDIRLNTINGTVTLEGSIKDPDKEQKLLKEIQKIPGVNSVSSRLQFNKDSK